MLSFMFSLNSQARESFKLGFGVDRGLGIVGSINQFNGFVGNDGFSIDYLFLKQSLKNNASNGVRWSVGAGGYKDWDGDFGVRLPVGIEWNFAKNIDAFAQAIPAFQIEEDSKFKLDFGLGIRYHF